MAHLVFYTSDGCSYEGMSEETVCALRAEAGLVTRFVTKEVYDEMMEILRNR